MGSVWVAGSYQSDYARNYAREGLEISDMVAEAVTGTLNDAGTELNMRNAKDNPLAQTRGWTFGPGSFADDDTGNPVVEGRLRRTDCSQVTDGTAGVLLVSDRFRKDHQSTKRHARIAGWGHGTAGLSLQAKFDRSQDQPYVFPHVRQVVTEAFRRAHIADVSALDGIETHDCFSM